MNLFYKFKSTVEAYGDKSALVIDDRSYTYRQYYDKAPILKHFEEKLPFSMLPKATFLTGDPPLNYHQKTDHKQLTYRIKKK